jgi:hypothetical protein
MIFETLHESAKRGELLCINGGFCHWHLRRDGQLTIREIIATERGRGSYMLAELKRIGQQKGAVSIFAKCPADLAANDWYAKKGFVLEGLDTTKNGRVLKLWRLTL